MEPRGPALTAAGVAQIVLSECRRGTASCSVKPTLSSCFLASLMVGSAAALPTLSVLNQEQLLSPTPPTHSHTHTRECPHPVNQLAGSNSSPQDWCLQGPPSLHSSAACQRCKSHRGSVKEEAAITQVPTFTTLVLSPTPSCSL